MRLLKEHLIMSKYIETPQYIKSFSIKDFAIDSLSARDYRTLKIKNKNTTVLSDLLASKHTTGKEISSINYMKKSKFRFLKTTNIGRNFLLGEGSIEYCKPEGKTFPKKNSILIAKDGGGDGLGEVCLYPYSNLENRDCLSAGIININIKDKYLYYVLGLLKHNHFKNFVDINTAQGSTIRHSKLIALEYEIPFPSINNSNSPKLVQKYISDMVQNLLDKESQIRIKNQKIDDEIFQELGGGSLAKSAPTKTTISKIIKTTRLDSGLYNDTVNSINNLIENYSFGFWSIGEKYNYSRGQNLQVSQIGKSFSSKSQKKGFYRIFTNTEMQDDRTISRYKWIGNKNKLSLLPDNAVIMSADGTVGRTFFYDKMPNTITNIHPWVITPINKETPIYSRVFLSVFLSFLKNKKYLEKIKDKSNGGGLKATHLEKWITIPNFPNNIQQRIAGHYYHKVDAILTPSLDNYLHDEEARNKILGIYQLNMEIMELKTKINLAIDKVINDQPIFV
jgi:hypothetical protein